MIEINYEAIGQLLKSKEMENCVKTIADGIAQSCGNGYATDVYQANTRVIASVYADSQDARLDNLENNTLLKASKI